MRFFSSKRFLQIGLIVNLLLLVVTGGGRGPLSLLTYEIVSVILFWFSRPHTLFKRTSLDFPLALFLFFLIVSTALSLKAGTRGMVQCAAILTHVLNFYLFLQAREIPFLRIFQWTILGISGLIGVLIISGEVMGYIYYSVERMIQEPVNYYAALFPNGNLDAGFLTCGILVCFSRVFFSTKTEAADRNVSEWGFRALLALLFGAEILFFSRGAMVSLILSLTLGMFSNPKKLFVFFSGSIIMLLSAMLLSPRIMHSFAAKIGTAGPTTRMTVWKGSYRAIQAKPLFGWGLSGFERAYKIYRPPMADQIGQYEKMTRFAHNEYLQAGVEMGLFGLGALLFLLFVIFRDAYSLNQSKEFFWERKAAFCMIVSILIHASMDFNLHLPIFGFIMVFASAACVRTAQDPSGREMFHVIPRQELIFGILAGSSFILASWVFTSFIIYRIGAHKAAQMGLSEALPTFRQAVRINPFGSDMLEDFILYPHDPNGTKIVEGAIQFHESDDRLHAYLARSYFLEGHLEKSIITFEKAIRLDPKNPFYDTELADICLRSGKFSQAEDLYLRAVALEPFYILAHYQLGVLYLLEGKKSKALAAFGNVRRIQSARLTADFSYARRLLDFPEGLVERRIKELENMRGGGKRK